MTAAPWEIVSDGGLRALVADGGGPASLGTADLELVQHAASAFEAGLLQIWVRDRGARTTTALLGAGSAAHVATADDVLTLTGCVAGHGGTEGLGWQATLALDPATTAWAWHVEVENLGQGVREVDLVHTHDVALAAPGALRSNELYVSQYLDVTPVHGEPFGTALAVRQNLPQGGRSPWCVLAASRAVVGWGTDALDLHGRTARVPAGGPLGIPWDLPSRRLQHEHTLVALQVAPAVLEPGDRLRVSFVGLLLADHPGATGPDDLAHVEAALASGRRSAPWSGGPVGEDGPRAAGPATGAVAPAHARPSRPAPAVPVGTTPAPTGVYEPGRELAALPLDEDRLHAEWPGPWRVVERGGDGAVHSFFTAGSEHVVTQAKELAVLRPHGTILRTGATAEPDPASLTVTAWMTGSPLSYLTRGHATTGRVLTTVRGYLNLHRAYGLRLFVEVGGRWRLLDTPSVFATTPEGARWLYAFADADAERPVGVVEVTTVAPPEEDRVSLTARVLDGPPRRILAALHLALPGEPLPPAAGASGIDVTVRGGDGDAAGRRIVVSGVGPDRDAALHVDTAGPVTVGDDAVLFDDGRARVPGVVTLVTPRVPAVGSPTPTALDLRVSVARTEAPERARASAPEQQPDAADAPASVGTWWTDVTPVRVEHPSADVEALDAALPWLVRDALVHFLAPRGLEQYTGGAWGTRDVTQGPLELLLALDRLDDARALVLRVFAAQNPDGSWPQAFGFLPGDEHFRHEPPHGDVVHWPVLALGRYLQASGDHGVLDEVVPWYAAPGRDAPAQAPVQAHVDRALALARAGYLPGTHLVAYGHGDWNDSLQPADPAMARTMASAWTATLHHDSLRALADGLDPERGDEPEPGAAARVTTLGRDAATLRTDATALRAGATALRTEADAVAADLRRHLLVDGELAGYALLQPPAESVDGRAHVGGLLVHPRDTESGLSHGALQMIHALGGDLFTPDEAAHHVALVREHLMGVDGVRLFDRPPGYHGGEMRHFQRAETATFVGREIGLMYVHAHLRWCEAMARWGDAEALWAGLRQVLPTTSAGVPGARPRQSSTYSSSSDAACLDRADFAARYADVLCGATGLEGGWRIYSSGPGVLLRVLTQSLLGVRRRAGHVEIDPVLPAALDGLRAAVPLGDGLLRLHVSVGPQGAGPDAVVLAGRELPTTRTPNPYRRGGLLVRLADLADALRPGGPELEVRLP